ncbi:hypothetical protein [Cryomorpha ignava]|uniref:hypothetical protein n=1 Tax=Cryomorpha ignava TaxID=101383 RepID=UPI001954ACF9|nr:hypothetical protein [Cryomorpha ignava]
MKIALILVAAFFAEAATAQRLQDWLNLGDKAMEENDPYGALRYYTRAMEMDSAKGEVKYKYAEALRANHDYAKAAYYYGEVYRRERGRIYPQGGVWLATMQKQAGEYAEAKQNWRRVRNQFSRDRNGYYYKKAVQEMRSTTLAMDWSKDETPFELEQIGEPINSEQSEFAGYFIDDGELIFSSLRGTFNEKGQLTSKPEKYIPRLYKADSALKTVEIYSEFPFSNPVFNYASSANEERIAVAGINKKGKNTISIFEKGSKSLIYQIPADSDTAWYSQPAYGFVGDRKVLFFSSNRPGGFGQEDIWYVFADEPNGEPVNAGKFVNSPGSEITPFYRGDLQKLYFASDWHAGFGGYDIFESDMIGSNLGFPENLKQPFNSPANDLYYSFNEKIGKGSISSNRLGSKANDGAGCCNDLWLFTEELIQKSDTLPQITTLEELNDYLPVKLYFHNDEPDPRTRTETTPQNYLDTYRNYVALLPEYRKEYRAGLTEDEGDEAEDAMDLFFIDEIDQGVNDLEQFTKLLLVELEKGQRVVVTVKGFASPLAETDYNVKLTSRRISSLENYLKSYKRGIFLPYFQASAEAGGTLDINKIPFGEYVASAVVSDNPNERNAIYSIAAAQERKIEIVSVQRAQNDTSLAEIRFNSEIQDFGTITAGYSIPFSFAFSCVGNLTIDSIRTNPMEITILDQSYENGSGRIAGILHPSHSRGKQNNVILIFANIPGQSRELNITYEIE